MTYGFKWNVLPEHISPSVIISCTFRFFPAFCFPRGDSSVIIKSILYDSVSKNSLRNRHIYSEALLIQTDRSDLPPKSPHCARNGKTWLIYCKMVYKFVFFLLNCLQPTVRLWLYSRVLKIPPHKPVKFVKLTSSLITWISQSTQFKSVIISAFQYKNKYKWGPQILEFTV